MKFPSSNKYQSVRIARFDVDFSQWNSIQNKSEWFFESKVLLIFFKFNAYNFYDNLNWSADSLKLNSNSYQSLSNKREEKSTKFSECDSISIRRSRFAFKKRKKNSFLYWVKIEIFLVVCKPSNEKKKNTIRRVRLLFDLQNSNEERRSFFIINPTTGNFYHRNIILRSR